MTCHLIFTLISFQTLLSPNAFGLGADYVAQYELKGEGIQFHNMNTSPVSHTFFSCANNNLYIHIYQLNDDAFSFSWVLIMMIVDSIIYWILTWYIEEVYPGMCYFNDTYYTVNKLLCQANNSVYVQ